MDFFASTTVAEPDAQFRLILCPDGKLSFICVLVTILVRQLFSWKLAKHLIFVNAAGDPAKRDLVLFANYIVDGRYVPSIPDFLFTGLRQKRLLLITETPDRK